MMSCVISPSPRHNHRVFFSSPPTPDFIALYASNLDPSSQHHHIWVHCVVIRPQTLEILMSSSKWRRPTTILSTMSTDHLQRPHQMRELCRPFVHTCSTYQRIVILNHNPNTQPWTSLHPFPFSPLTFSFHHPLPQFHHITIQTQPHTPTLNTYQFYHEWQRSKQ